MAEQYISTDPNAGVEESPYLSTDPNAGLEQLGTPTVGTVLKRAGEAAVDVAKGFVRGLLPRVEKSTLAEIFGGPAAIGPIEAYKAIEGVGQTVKGVQEAEKTPAFSKERFEAGFNVAAQLGMVALGARGARPKPLSETFFGKPEATVEPPAAPATETAARTEVIKNATQERQVQENVPTERARDDALRASTTPSPSSSLRATTQGIQEESPLDPSGRVKPGMFGSANEHEVFNSVISSVPVDVVNKLGGEQRAAQVLLHDPTVLKDFLAANPDTDVSVLSDAAVKGAARLRAELPQGETGRGNVKLLPALDTLNQHISEVRGASTSPAGTGAIPPTTARPTATDLEGRAAPLAGKRPEIQQPSVPQSGGSVKPKILSTAVQTPEGIKTGTFNQPHEEIIKGAPEENRGFMVRDADGTERFVGRQEGADIAKAAGQVKPENAGTTELHSQQLTPPAEPPVTPKIETSSTEPHVSAIANRFTEERVKAGEIGEIAPGQGHSTEELVQRGLKMPPEEINQHVSDLMQGTGDIVKQGQAVRAEEARLSQRSNQASRELEADPNNAEKKLAADNAFKDLTDFHNGPVALLKNKWHATGMEMQGEIPVDLSTFNGMREAWFKDLGTMPPPEVESMLRETAKKVAGANGEADAAINKVGQAIDKVTKARKTLDYEQVRNNILERLKGRTPCN